MAINSLIENKFVFKRNKLETLIKTYVIKQAKWKRKLTDFQFIRKDCKKCLAWWAYEFENARNDVIGYAEQKIKLDSKSSNETKNKWLDETFEKGYDEKKSYFNKITLFIFRPCVKIVIKKILTSNFNSYTKV